MKVNKSQLREIIEEELSRSDVSSMINDKMSSSDFKKKVKSLASEVVNELFKILWQRNSFWKNNVV